MAYKKKTIKSEKDFWNLLHGRRSNRASKAADRGFRILFPTGHKYSLRPILEGYLATNAEEIEKRAKKFTKYLEDVHPSALKLLVRYGLDYTPLVWRKSPLAIEPRFGKCYFNARIFMLGQNKVKAERKGIGTPDFRSRIGYVEGIVMGSLTFPMLHAWNAFGNRGRVAIDWSHYAATRWNRYLGIPLTDAEYSHAMHLVFPKNDHVDGLFTREHYPQVRKYLEWLLEKRYAK